VVIDNAEGAESGNTPAEEEDDFFSSWSRPAVKKLSPPISRTATPPVVGRTPSPFLNAQNGKDTARSASPLAKGGEGEAANKPPAASRITTSAALRSNTTGPRKANILGAKKVTSKLGAKKLGGGGGGGGDILIDFDEAEKKAKEEAERIEKLGYDPDAEEEAPANKTSSKSESAIVSPTPVSPARGGYGSSHTCEKSAAEVERLGMGMGRLGFGQVGKPAGAAAAAQKKNAGGFGSVGPIKASAEGTFLVSLSPSYPTPLTD
jgi:ADP-ribosylation factor GTPase-activating protein 2/3